jgi:hypothetical protein
VQPDDGANAVENAVEVGYGEHDATIRLVELPDFGEQLRTVDEYTWTFTVQ